MPGGKHGQPSTGDGTNRSRPKLGKAEVKVQSATGAWLWKQIAGLWGDNKK